MFETLAPKLNGGKPPSQQGVPDMVRSSGGNDGEQTLKANSSKPGVVSTAAVGPHGGPHPYITSRGAGIRAANESSTGQASTISRQSNPFAKGFTKIQFGGMSTPNTPPAIHPKTAISHKSASPPSLETSRSHTTSSHNHPITAHAKPGSGSSALAQGKTNGSAIESTATHLDADISFGPDDFLMGDDGLDLVDLMGDLEDDKDDKEPPISWAPTPIRTTPLAANSASAPPSQICSASTQPTTAIKITSTTAPFYNIHLKNKPSGSPTSIEGSSARSVSAMSKLTEAAPQRNTFDTLKSTIPINNPGSLRLLAVNSQEHPSSRPNEHDTVAHRHTRLNQGQPPAIRDLQVQERRGFSRSKSSPSAGSNTITLPVRSRRRLPGPAGNLPILSTEEKEQLFRSRGVPFGKDAKLANSAAGSISPNSSIKKKMKAAVQHGPVDNMFANGAWEEMLKAYGLPDYKPSTLIRWKGMAPMIELSLSDITNRPELHRGKISALVVMIKEVALSEIDASVTLVDPSGEMRGTVHRTVLEQYKNNEIRTGTVLALKNVSVFSPTPISHYLIITSRNIIGIFLPRPSTIILSQGSSQDRLSQKRRRAGQDSQEFQGSSRSSWSDSSQAGSSGDSGPALIASPSTSQQPLTISSSPMTSDIASSMSAPNPNTRLRRSPSPDWPDTQEDSQIGVNDAIQTNSAPLELQHIAVKQEEGKLLQGSQDRVSATAEIVHKRQRHENHASLVRHPSSQLQASQTQGVQFQSLRQTLGGASMHETQQDFSQLDHVTATPVIALGIMTPETTEAIGSTAPGSSRGLLSFFAASPELRKRSAPSAISQRSGSSELNLGAGGGQTQSSTPAALGTIPPSSLSTKTLHRFSSSDWPGDFRDVDLAKALEDDSIAKTTEQPSNNRSTRSAAITPVSRPPLPHDDDDDLDKLLDGLDEAELYDL
ncbi:hypothetical protein EDD11_002599 [Mortierella claussenii]|nr:hypothetical protein EDD11_002599 [Mortierella claussenii]